jgi:hypothetical protein
MSSQLPSPGNLEEATQEVILQNKSVGYIPTRFIGATQEGYAPNLVQVCTNLIHSDGAVQALLEAIPRYPGLLTLEDLVIRSKHGKEWGFDPVTTERAEATVQLLDRLAGYQRWSR